MKKMFAFALVACLFVLAVAAVIGMTNPGVHDSIGDVLRGILQSIKDLLYHLIDHLRDLFTR